MLIYIAGPMSSYPLYNFPAFHAAAKKLRDAGPEVWNPAENDERKGFDPSKDKAEALSVYMQDDLPNVCKADAVVVLEGWEKSKGVQIELMVAQALGKPVFDLEMKPITAGRKFDGAKPKWGLLPWPEAEQIVKVLTIGAEKYSAGNWMTVPDARARYFDAMIRHICSWHRGEKIDKDTGQSHLACAGCCMLFLMWFDNQENVR